MHPPAEVRGQRAEARGQRAEVKGQRSVGRSQRAERWGGIRCSDELDLDHTAVDQDFNIRYTVMYLGGETEWVGGKNLDFGPHRGGPRGESFVQR